jgi:hypothetical protein
MDFTPTAQTDWVLAKVEVRDPCVQRPASTLRHDDHAVGRVGGDKSRNIAILALPVPVSPGR